MVAVQSLGRQKLSKFPLVPHPVDDAGTGQDMSDADGVEVEARDEEARDEEHRGYTRQLYG